MSCCPPQILPTGPPKEGRQRFCKVHLQEGSWGQMVAVHIETSSRSAEALGRAAASTRRYRTKLPTAPEAGAIVFYSCRSAHGRHRCAHTVTVLSLLCASTQLTHSSASGTPPSRHVPDDISAIERQTCIACLQGQCKGPALPSNRYQKAGGNNVPPVFGCAASDDISQSGQCGTRW